MIAVDLAENKQTITIEIMGNKQVFYSSIDKIKRFRGANFDGDTNLWHLPRSKATLKKLQRKFKKVAFKQNKYVLAGIKEPVVPTGADIMMNAIDENTEKYIKKYNLDELKLPLKSFQKLGVLSALYFLKKFGGFLIADEMGLGKTVEALGCMHALKEDIENVLVIVPKNVKGQWDEEVEKFTNLKSVVVDGYNKEKRLECFDKEGDIYIINKEQLILDDDFDRIKEMNPDMIVVDEIHYFKNHDAQRTGQLKKLRNSTKYRLGLTGTPLQNKPADFHSIFEFLVPKALGNWKQFKKEYIYYTYRYDYPEPAGYKNLFKLKQIGSKYKIRRRTEDVADDMPDLKGPKSHKVKMNEIQQQIHQQLEEKIEELREKEQKLKRKDPENEELEDIDGKIMGYMNIQLEVSDDLRLLKQSDSHMVKKLVDGVPMKPSPKTNYFLNLIENILNYNPEFKVVVFSKFARMVQLLEKEVGKLEVSDKIATIYGELNERQRNKNRHMFVNDDDCRIIIMSDAGAEGLNLQRASHLINFDLPWNPSQLDQRNGRIRRIGSRWDEVYVSNLVSENAIDEKIVKAIANKREIFDKIVENTDDQTKALKKMARQIS
jgi:SNF2 family DNA or RNA helicase